MLRELRQFFSMVHLTKPSLRLPFNCRELDKFSWQHQERRTSQGGIWKKQQTTAFKADPGRQSTYVKQAGYKSRILRTAPK